MDQRPALGADEMYCSSCGSIIKKQAEICIKCGVRVARPATAAPAVGGKSKTASILLAVFLGFWTWLYTYKRDGPKFWTGLGLSAISWFIYAIGVSASLLGGAAAALFAIVVFILIGLAIWIWAIVDAAVKKDEWYANY